LPAYFTARLVVNLLLPLPVMVIVIIIAPNLFFIPLHSSCEYSGLHEKKGYHRNLDSYVGSIRSGAKNFRSATLSTATQPDTTMGIGSPSYYSRVDGGCPRTLTLRGLEEPSHASRGLEEPFFQLCCCVSFWFWREIGFSCTYYYVLGVPYSCGVVLFFLVLAGNSFWCYVHTYLVYNTVASFFCCGGKVNFAQIPYSHDRFSKISRTFFV
jgi:hypothetical protein